MRKRLFVFLAIICIALAGFVISVRMSTDKEGPKIYFDDSDITFSDDMTNEELLEGVRAEDEIEGDVSDTLTVESVYPIDDETAVAVYVAKDSKNNITKVKREMKYEGESDDKESSEKEKNNEKESSEDEETKENTESDVTPAVTEAPEENSAEAQQPEETPSPSPDAELQANTAAEEEAARTEQETLAAQMPAQSPRIYLTDYLIHIKQGENIDKLSYVKEIQDDADNISELWHYIQVDGTLDTNVPGTYELTYYVTDSNNNISNMAVLKVIVE